MQFFKDLKMRYKLIGSFFFVTLIFLIVVGIYQFTIFSIRNGYELAINSPIKAASHMDKITIYILKSQLDYEMYGADNNTKFLTEAAQNLSKIRDELAAVKGCAKRADRDDLLPVFDAMDTLYEDCIRKNDTLMGALKSEGGSERIQTLIEAANESILEFQKMIDTVQVEAQKDATKFVEITHEKSNKLAGTAMIIAVIASIIGILASIFISLSISNPIGNAVNFAEEISKGNFTEELAINRKDEIGILAGALNQMKTDLSHMVHDLRHTSEQMASSSSELAAISSQMAMNAENTSQSASNVSNASEEMSVNMSAVATAMEESSTNTTMVATAAEEMNSTINEIAQNAEQAKTISTSAVAQSNNAKDKMNELGKAAQAIGKVTEAITEISEQTNLLALNATIEAARAGEAGKGFNVVANEIKDLAKQTAEATLDIKNQINAVQETTGSAITEIDEVTGVIKNIDDIVSTIVSAIEEQLSTTKEIAANIAQASQGINEVNENVSNSSQMAQSINTDIAMVSSQTQEISNGISQLKHSAEQLNEFSENLNQLISQFRV